MAQRDVIVIGASAGGVEALTTFVAALPAGLPATVLVVLHLPPDAHSLLPAILMRAGRLPAAHPRGDSVLEPGTIFVAPPDRHLTMRGEVVHLSRGPRIHGHRPAVDALFQTAADSLGPRVMGVLLSGLLDDGAAGMLAIKRAGGLTLVQDSRDALFAGMPESVLARMEVDYVLPARDLGIALGALAGRPVAGINEGTNDRA